MELDQDRECFGGLAVDPDLDVGAGAAPIREQRSGDGRAGVVKPAESILTVRLLFRGLDNVGVKAEAGSEQRVAMHLASVGFTFYRDQGSEARVVGADQKTGSLSHLLRYAHEPGIDIGGAGRDHPECRLGAGQDMADVVNDPVSSHSGDHVITISHCGGGQLAGVIGRLRPGWLDLVFPPEDAEHRAMGSPGELGGGRVGDQQEPAQDGKATGLASNLVIEQTPADSASPLFSLLNGEGAGAMLAAAAGDVAGGASPLGYSAVTQQSTVLAYHVLRHASVERPQLAQDWLELGSDGESPSVYRSPSPEFDGFLRAVREGEAAASAEPSLEPAARIHPVGVWFRRDPDRLVETAMAAARLTHIDAATVLGAVTVAGAVAASCFAQSGRDLMRASVEISNRCLAAIDKEAFLYSRVDDARAWADLLTESVDWVGRPAVELVADTEQFGSSNHPAYRGLLAILIVAPFNGEPYRQVEQAASLGGSELAAIVGAMAGARAGLRLWPWIVPNDTWFVEIGRRLVSGNQETRDIPVPYYVEERLTFGGQRNLI